MTDRALPFLMFQGNVGRAALDFYVSLFDDGEILELDTYPAGTPAPEGSIMRAKVRFAGQEVYASDSFIDHEFGFTPSMSFWVEAESAERQAALVGALAEGGTTLMPLGNYGFSSSFAWVADKYGVTWQVNVT